MKNRQAGSSRIETRNESIEGLITILGEVKSHEKVTRLALNDQAAQTADVEIELPEDYTAGEGLIAGLPVCIHQGDPRPEQENSPR